MTPEEEKVIVDAIQELVKKHTALGKQIEALIARADPNGLEEKAEKLIAERVRCRVEMRLQSAKLGYICPLGDEPVTSIN